MKNGREVFDDAFFLYEDGDISMGRVFSMSLSEDRQSVIALEGCDQYFDMLMNKDEFGKLIAAMQEMHNMMKP